MIKKTPALRISAIGLAILFESGVQAANWSHAAHNPLDDPPLADVNLPVVFATSTASSLDTIVTFAGPTIPQPVNMVTGEEIEPAAHRETPVEQAPAGPKMTVRQLK